MTNKIFWNLVDKLDRSYNVDVVKVYIEVHKYGPDCYNEFVDWYASKVAILRNACAEMSPYSKDLRSVMSDGSKFLHLMRGAVLCGQQIWQEMVDMPDMLAQESFSAEAEKVFAELFPKEEAAATASKNESPKEERKAMPDWSRAALDFDDEDEGDYDEDAGDGTCDGYALLSADGDGAADVEGYIDFAKAIIEDVKKICDAYQIPMSVRCRKG